MAVSRQQQHGETPAVLATEAQGAHRASVAHAVHEHVLAHLKPEEVSMSPLTSIPHGRGANGAFRAVHLLVLHTDNQHRQLLIVFLARRPRLIPTATAGALKLAAAAVRDATRASACPAPSPSGAGLSCIGRRSAAAA